MRNPSYIAPARIEGGPVAPYLPAGHGAAAAGAFGVVAEGVERFAAVLFAREERQQRLAMMTAMARAKRELAEGAAQIVEGDDWRQYLNRYRALEEAIRGKWRGTLPEGLHQEFDARIEDDFGIGFRQVAAAARKAESTEAVETVEDLAATNLDLILKTRDPEQRQRLIDEVGGAIAELRNGGHVGAGNAGRRLRGWYGEVQKAIAEQAQGELRLAITQDPAGVARRLRAGAVPELGDQQRAQLIEHAESVARAREADFRRQQAEAEREAERKAAERREETIADFNLQLSRGTLTIEAVEDAKARGILRPTVAASYRIQIEEKARKAEAELAPLRLVQAAAETGAPILDPKNSDHRKAVDQHYVAAAAQWSSLSGEEQLAAAADYVRRVGMVPRSMAGQIRAGARSEDDEVVALSADLLDRVLTVKPAAIDDFAREDVDLLLSVAELTRSGTAPKEAVRVAREASKVSDPLKKARVAEIREQKLIDKGRQALKSELAARDGRWTLFTPELPTELTAEFDRLFQQRYIASGNAAAAEKAAMADLQRVWAWSEVDGGGRWMRYAPEALYGNGRDPAWMRAQLEAEVKEKFGIETGGGKRVMLVPDGLTARPGPDGRPSWQVFVQDENGINPLEVAPGVPWRWHPDWAASEEGKREAADLAAELEAARAGRAGIAALNALGRQRQAEMERLAAQRKARREAFDAVR